MNMFMPFTYRDLSSNLSKLRKQQVSEKRLRVYWRGFLTWCFSGLRDTSIGYPG